MQYRQSSIDWKRDYRSQIIEDCTRNSVLRSENEKRFLSHCGIVVDHGENSGISSAVNGGGVGSTSAGGYTAVKLPRSRKASTRVVLPRALNTKMSGPLAPTAKMWMWAPSSRPNTSVIITVWMASVPGMSSVF